MSCFVILSPYLAQYIATYNSLAIPLKFHLSSYSSPLQYVKAKPSVCVSGDAAIPRRCGMSGLWQHQSVLLFTIPQAAHTPLVSSQAYKCPGSGFSFCHSTEGALHLWAVIPLAHQRGAFHSVFLPYNQGGQRRINYKAQATNLWRLQAKAWGISARSEATLTGTHPQALPGTALRTCRLNTFSALSLIIPLFCVGGNTNKVKLWPFQLPTLLSLPLLSHTLLKPRHT